ncbi:hypothetical protein GA0115254_100729 [Streptomyces sp. Ncost-T10-10d]|nr:hypothetical protein GA0115254_100729 [Streptomyces sp. Ncost-T10-10d]
MSDVPSEPTGAYAVSTLQPDALRDRMAAGETISGPAAGRAVTAAAQAPRFMGRIIPRTFAKKAADYLVRDGIVLFDNPDALLICVFKRGNALCDLAPDSTAPNQYAWVRPGHWWSSRSPARRSARQGPSASRRGPS